MVTREPVKIDLDYATELEIIGVWKQMEMIGTPFGRVSSGGAGVHIQVHDCGFGGTSPLGFRVRELAGDDRLRMAIDRVLSDGYANVTFDTKLGKEAGPYRDNLTDLLIDFRT